jgi:hypothetical protein
VPRPRPATVIMVAFATGSVTIQCAKGKPEVKALMNVPDENGMGVATRVSIPSISETDVKEDPRSAIIQYSLKNEEIEFRRKDVVFWSVSEAVDPPLIQTRQEAIIR